MRAEDFEECAMLGTADAFEVEDLAEVCFGAVSDVDEVGGDESFWW